MLLARLVISILAATTTVVVAAAADPAVDAVPVNNDPNSKYNEYEFDLSLNYLKNKVWDAIIVTDDLGLNGNTAPKEDVPFMKALERLGRKVHRASIQDKTFDWRAGKSIILRSAWNKYDWLDDYLRFLDTVNTHSFLFNQPQLIRWQSDKVSYMRQLANFVKVPYTLIVRSEESEYPSYSKLVDILNCTDIIIKPTGGNSGIGVKLINQDKLDLYKRKMEKYLWSEKEDMLIQCYMYSVTHDGPGEINVYMIDGKVTHAGYSIPAVGHYLIHEEYGGDGDDLVPSKAEIEFATKVYNAASTIVGVKPLYFRVDMMYDNDGELTLMEIACGTTDMNFRDEPAAADTMAQALDRFLSEKEAAYEQVYGQIPPLIELHAFEKLVTASYDKFGTPLRDGAYGREKPWRHTNRTIPQEKEEEKASPMEQPTCDTSPKLDA